MFTAEQMRAYEKLSVESASARASRGRRSSDSEPTEKTGPNVLSESIAALAFASEGFRAAS